MIPQINNAIDIFKIVVGLIALFVIVVVLISWKKKDDDNDPHSFIG